MTLNELQSINRAIDVLNGVFPESPVNDQFLIVATCHSKVAEEGTYRTWGEPKDFWYDTQTLAWVYVCTKAEFEAQVARRKAKKHAFILTAVYDGIYREDNGVSEVVCVFSNKPTVEQIKQKLEEWQAPHIADNKQMYYQNIRHSLQTTELV